MSSVRRLQPLAPLFAALVAMPLATMPALADHGQPHVVLESGTGGCTGVLPSTDGNTDMRVIGGTQTPGGTAIFEITYPVNAANVGKEFTITDCAYINDVAALKYTVSFVPSNQSYVLRIALAVPDDAPVGGLYCNYVKTTGSPTASQASQRKAGPACFTIRPPSGSPPSQPGSPGSNPTTGSPSSPDLPTLLPDTAVPVGRMDGGGRP